MSDIEGSSFEVVYAGVSDAEEIGQLHGRCFSEGWDGMAMAAYASDPACHLLTAREGEGGPSIGLILARSVRDEAEILTLAVAPQARRCGVAGLLWLHLKDDLATRGVARVFLEVGRGNRAGIELYRGLGFQTVAERQGYYGRSGEDALVMVLGIAG